MSRQKIGLGLFWIGLLDDDLDQVLLLSTI